MAGVNRPDLDGGSGGVGPGGGGGAPGTPTGSSTGPSLPVGENGGVLANTYYLFVPVQDSRTGICYIGFFDVSSFDDTIDGSSYSYRQEDVIRDCVPTVNRVVLTYRDIGQAQLTVTLKGTNDRGEVVSQNVLVQLGNALPTNALLTKIVDIELTAYRPQLILSRAAGGGPFAITSATMRGTVSEVEQY